MDPKIAKGLGPAVMMALALAALPGAGAAAADAAKGKAFFRGKTIMFVIATGPGGGHDYYGRLITRYMAKSLPGVTFVVRNMPGAGHIIGTNYIYNSKPNGLTFGAFSAGPIYGQLIKRKGVRFDLAKMSWIGKAATEGRLIVVAATSPYKTLADIKSSTTEVKFGSSGVGGANFNEAYMIRNTFGLPIKIIPGYTGADSALAILRGEVVGRVGSASSNEQFLKSGKFRAIVQFGKVLPGVPDAQDVAPNADARAVSRLIEAQARLSRLMAGPPAIPADRLAALRAAYRAAVDDPKLKAEAEKLDRPLDPLIGEDVRKIVVSALDQPQSVKSLIRDITAIKVALLKYTGKVVKTEGGGRKVTINLGSQRVWAKISGSRTKVSVGGRKAKRKSIKLGMSCTFTYTKAGSEAKSVDCK